jgi:hypothetical protein
MGFVQSASNTGTGSVTATFGSSTTAANTIIAMISNAASSAFTAFTGVTLTGSADTFVKQEASASNASDIDAEHWSDIGCAGGHTAVVAAIGAVNATQINTVEWNGITAVDKKNIGSNNAGVTSSSSGASGTLTQASEVAFGQVFWDTLGGGTPTVTGPASPWTNFSSISGAAGDVQLAGYQAVSATTSLTYTTTSSITAVYQSIIVTYKTTTTVNVNLPVVQTTSNVPALSNNLPILIIAIAAVTCNDPETGVVCEQGVTVFSPGNTLQFANMYNNSITFQTALNGVSAPVAASIAGLTPGELVMSGGNATNSDTSAVLELLSSANVNNSSGVAIANVVVTGGSLQVNGTTMTVP